MGWFSVAFLAFTGFERVPCLVRLCTAYYTADVEEVAKLPPVCLYHGRNWDRPSSFILSCPKTKSEPCRHTDPHFLYRVSCHDANTCWKLVTRFPKRCRKCADLSTTASAFARLDQAALRRHSKRACETAWMLGSVHSTESHAEIFGWEPVTRERCVVKGVPVTHCFVREIPISLGLTQVWYVGVW